MQMNDFDRDDRRDTAAPCNKPRGLKVAFLRALAQRYISSSKRPCARDSGVIRIDRATKCVIAGFMGVKRTNFSFPETEATTLEVSPRNVLLASR